MAAQNLSNQYKYPLFITIYSRLTILQRPTAGEYTCGIQRWGHCHDHHNSSIGSLALKILMMHSLKTILFWLSIAESFTNSKTAIKQLQM
jgi:hypothetical protein